MFTMDQGNLLSSVVGTLPSIVFVTFPSDLLTGVMAWCLTGMEHLNSSTRGERNLLETSDGHLVVLHIFIISIISV